MGRQVGVVAADARLRTGQFVATQVGFFHGRVGELVTGRGVAAGAADVNRVRRAVDGGIEARQIDGHGQHFARREDDLGLSIAVAGAAGGFCRGVGSRGGRGGRLGLAGRSENRVQGNERRG